MKELILFPKIDAVFNDPTERHSEVFMPVVSIPKSLINNHWDGLIHVIQFNEDPYNGERVKYFNKYCCDYRISFTANNEKYDFDTDLKFFDTTDDWKRYQIETKEKFEISKKKYFDTGENFGLPRIQIGGEPEWWQTDETPIDMNGNSMTFITEIETYQFCPDSIDKKIYVFYSHDFNKVVHLYQIT